MFEFHISIFFAIIVRKTTFIVVSRRPFHGLDGIKQEVKKQHGLRGTGGHQMNLFSRILANRAL
jgi:hypothetical protein